MLRLTSLYLLAAILHHAEAVEIIAHRGASHDAPEDTLAAVSLGWKRNADAVEVDVYLSEDKQIVAIHDKNTKRSTGHDGLVKEMTWPAPHSPRPAGPFRHLDEKAISFQVEEA
jgi:glycerophosphoryl diester phosphodiesterase